MPKWQFADTKIVLIMQIKINFHLLVCFILLHKSSTFITIYCGLKDNRLKASSMVIFSLASSLSDIDFSKFPFRHLVYL